MWISLQPWDISPLKAACQSSCEWWQRITRDQFLILTNILWGVLPSLPHNHHMTYTTLIRAAHKEKIEINEPSQMIISHLSVPSIGQAPDSWPEHWALIGCWSRTNNCLGRDQYCHKYLFSVLSHHHMDLQYANSDTQPIQQGTSYHQEGKEKSIQWTRHFEP